VCCRYPKTSPMAGNTGTGFIAVTGPVDNLPVTSSVNWFASPMTRANGAMVPVERTASEAFVGGRFATEYVHDSAGYFR
jgi:hypothetical protein